MLTDGDKAIIQETAWAVGKEIAAEIKRDTQVQLRLHAAECPVAKKLEKQSNQVLGGWKTLTIVGSALLALAALALQLR